VVHGAKWQKGFEKFMSGLTIDPDAIAECVEEILSFKIAIFGSSIVRIMRSSKNRGAFSNLCNAINFFPKTRNFFYQNGTL